MEKNDKPLSPEQMQVNTLVAGTMKDVAKLENDMKKSPSRLQLNLTPLGMQDVNAKQILQDNQKIKSQIEVLKDGALIKANELTTHMPKAEQKRMHQDAIEKLNPGASPERKEQIENKHKSFSSDEKNHIVMKSETIKSTIHEKENKQTEEKDAFVSKFMKADISKPEKVSNDKLWGTSRIDSKFGHAKELDKVETTKKESEKNISKTFNDKGGKDER